MNAINKKKWYREVQDLSLNETRSILKMPFTHSLMNDDFFSIWLKLYCYFLNDNII